MMEEFLKLPRVNINAQDFEGNSALHYATKWKNKRVVEFLLNHENIRCNLRNNMGQTALHVAVERGSFGLVKMVILHKKVDILIRDWSGVRGCDYLLTESAYSTKEVLKLAGLIYELTAAKLKAVFKYSKCKPVWSNPELLDYLEHTVSKFSVWSPDSHIWFPESFREIIFT